MGCELLVERGKGYIYYLMAVRGITCRAGSGMSPRILMGGQEEAAQWWRKRVREWRETRARLEEGWVGGGRRGEGKERQASLPPQLSMKCMRGSR